MQLLSIDKPQEPFWSRRILRFAAAGLGVYLVTQWLPLSDSLWLLAVVDVARLGLLLMLPGMRRSWLLLLAAPYPFALAFTLYARRSDWMPEELALQISGQTAFLMCVGGALLLSIVFTAFIVDKAAKRPVEAHLRTLSGILFALTALAVIIPIPTVSVLVMRYAAEPAALIGYAAVLGWGNSIEDASG